MIRSSLAVVRWNLNVVVTGISLLAKDAEHSLTGEKIMTIGVIIMRNFYVS